MVKTKEEFDMEKELIELSHKNRMEQLETERKNRLEVAEFEKKCRQETEKIQHEDNLTMLRLKRADIKRTLEAKNFGRYN